MSFFRQLFRMPAALMALTHSSKTYSEPTFPIPYPTEWRVISHSDDTYTIQPPKMSIIPDPGYDVAEWRYGVNQIRIYRYPSSDTRYSKIHVCFGNEASSHDFQTLWESLGHSGSGQGAKFFIEVSGTDIDDISHKVRDLLNAIATKEPLDRSQYVELTNVLQTILTKDSKGLPGLSTSTVFYTSKHSKHATPRSPDLE